MFRIEYWFAARFNIVCEDLRKPNGLPDRLQIKVEAVHCCSGNFSESTVVIRRFRSGQGLGGSQVSKQITDLLVCQWGESVGGH